MQNQYNKKVEPLTC